MSHLGRYCTALLPLAGCGALPFSSVPTLLTIPLSIDGQEVEPALVDTGGDFEILLRDPMHLDLVGQARILAFHGPEVVDITESFDYSAAGVRARAAFAIVGLSSCDCNGVGYQFFRKSGAVLKMDFARGIAEVRPSAPSGIAVIFHEPPAHLAGFRTSFIQVEIGLGFTPPEPSQTKTVTALFDTGAGESAVSRRIVEANPSAQRASITISQELLGTVAASPILFDTEGLPDLIIGADIMRTWGEEWHFQFSQGSGSVVVVNRKVKAEIDDSGAIPSDSSQR